MNSPAPWNTTKWLTCLLLTAVVVFPAIVWRQNQHTSVTTTDSHGHDHAAHSDSESLELSDQALSNIGLSSEQIRPVQFQTFRKSITVPAVIIERPGRTRVIVATPLTGVITHVHAVSDEAILPGALLFQIRLTHEDLVQAQIDFLRTLGELDVENQEIQRLSSATRSGAVAGKVLLEREYAKSKLSALLNAQREGLRLHGLAERHVEQISTSRRLLRELQIYSPNTDEDADDELKLSSRSSLRKVSFLKRPIARRTDGEPPTLLVMTELSVHKGQSVTAGETLCTLTDYRELYVEGLAFEQDVSKLRNASAQGWKVTAVFDQPGSATKTVEDLEIAYMANHVDITSRALHFYVRFPNQITIDKQGEFGRFVEWEYLPGQRLQLRVPVKQWTNQIVLPIEAVAREGAEYFVFQQNGKHFARIPVQVKYRDQFSVVIANDGSLFAGDMVAMLGAHQMQMALKNKANGRVDAHAGHVH